MEKELKKRTAITITGSKQLQALKIAKVKGINTFSSLVDILIAEFIENNREILERKCR